MSAVHFDYGALTDVLRALESQGAQGELKYGGSPSAHELNEIARICHGLLPDAAYRLYAVCNGLLFRWKGPEGTRGHLILDEVGDLLSLHRSWQDILDDLGIDPSRPGPAPERLMPWIDVGNGDLFCLEIGTDAVFYHEPHFLSGPGPYATYVAESWDNFVAEWAKVCFEWPDVWPLVLTSDGVDWESPRFSRRYRWPW